MSGNTFYTMVVSGSRDSKGKQKRGYKDCFPLFVTMETRHTRRVKKIKLLSLLLFPLDLSSAQVSLGLSKSSLILS